MIRKIPVAKLTPGMFVDDFNCSWLRHPFLRRRVKITNQKMIDKIIQYGIREVYIDTGKGLDVKGGSLGRGLLNEIHSQLAIVLEGKYGIDRHSPDNDKTPAKTNSKTAPSIKESSDALAHWAEEETPEEIEAEPVNGRAEPIEPMSRLPLGGTSGAGVPTARMELGPDGEEQPNGAPVAESGSRLSSSTGIEQPDQTEAREQPADITSPEDLKAESEPTKARHATHAPPDESKTATVTPHRATGRTEARRPVARSASGGEESRLESEAGEARPLARVLEGESESRSAAPARPAGETESEQPVPVTVSGGDTETERVKAAASVSSDEKEALREAQSGLAGEIESGPPLPKSVPLQDEMHDATRIKTEARQTVQKMLEDARLGKQIQMEKVYPMVGKMVDSILRNPDALLTLSALKKTDDYTYTHSLSTCVLMICFARSLYLSKDVVTQAGVGALMHDLGKVKVPPEILNKAGKLTEEEDEKLKQHVEYGRAILSRTRGVPAVAMKVAVEHHERYDGTGFPRGLKGEEISLYGQAAAIVNMYDILTSERWYRKGMEPTEALSKILEWSKVRFSEEMVLKFIRCIGIYPIGTLVRMESGLLGVVVEQGSKDLLHPVVRTIYDTKREWFVKPRDLDLSNYVSKKPMDKIVCHESPDKWKIKPQVYLSGRVEESSLLSRRLHGSFAH